MSERRYSEDEVALIFARASEKELTAPRRLGSGDTGEGLTLADLKQIGREAGIAPELVAQAARDLEQIPQPATVRFLGLPLGVGRMVRLDRRLTDQEWERLVVLLRDTFDARGTVRMEGSFRQWTNGNLQVLVEPDGEGQRIRMRTLRGQSRAFMMAGLGMAGISGAITLASALTGAADVANVLGEMMPLLVIGAGMFGLGAVRLPGWARRRQQQMDQIAAQLMLPAPDDSTSTT